MMEPIIHYSKRKVCADVTHGDINSVSSNDDWKDDILLKQIIRFNGYSGEFNGAWSSHGLEKCFAYLASRSMR